MRGALSRIVAAAFCAWTSGCGRVDQSPECRAFVECVAKLDAQTGRSTDVLRFEAEGPCWGSEAGADLCTRSCARGIEVLLQQHPALGTCGESP